MNIAQELSIVRDNIAEYGMTNITQLEYDAIYEQGRQDAMNDDGIPKQLLEMGYKKGKEDANKEIEPMIREIHDAVYNEAYLKGIEQSAKAFGYVYDGECDSCPARFDCEFGKPCEETIKEYIINFKESPNGLL